MKIQFLKLDKSLITDTSIDAYQFRIYTYLVSLHNNEKGCSFPSIETMANKLNIGLTTIKKAIKKLKELGYIQVEKQKAKIGNFNKYICKHIISNKKIEAEKVDDNIGEIRNSEEIKKEKVDNNNNIRFLRKYVDIDSNEAIKDLCTTFSYKNVVEGYRLFKNKVENNIWKVNSVSNLFRDVVQVYYNENESIPKRAFNFYRKYMDNLAIQPIKRELPKDSTGKAPIDNQFHLDDLFNDNLYI